MNKYIIRGICVAFNDNEPHTQRSEGRRTTKNTRR